MTEKDTQIDESFQKPLEESVEDLLALRVAEAAKKHIISWVKWILGVCGLIIAILGIQFHSMTQKIDQKITTAVNARIDKIVGDKTAEIDRRTQLMIDRHIESLVTTRIESQKAIEQIKNQANVHLETLSRESSLILDEFEKSRKEVARVKSLMIARFSDVTYAVKQGVNPTVSVNTVFGTLPERTIGIHGAGPNGRLLDALIDGTYGSPFLRFFLPALRNADSDKNNDQRITINEANQMAIKLIKKSQFSNDFHPVIEGYQKDFAFISLSNGKVSKAYNGNLICVIIGINDYQVDRGELRGCVPDANLFRKFLINNDLITPDKCWLILDQEATRNNIVNRIKKSASLATANDILIIFFVGHLCPVTNPNDSKNPFQAMCPYDYNVKEDELISLPQLYKIIDKTQAKMTLLMIT